MCTNIFTERVLRFVGKVARRVGTRIVDCLPDVAYVRQIYGTSERHVPEDVFGGLVLKIEKMGKNMKYKIYTSHTCDTVFMK